MSVRWRRDRCRIIPTFERIYRIRDGLTYEEPGHTRAA
jgi:hypothetical protein